jgi:hypothetical protein
MILKINMQQSRVYKYAKLKSQLTRLFVKHG